MIRAFLPLVLLTSLAPLSRALDESREKAKEELNAALKTEDEARLKSASRASRLTAVSYMKDLERKLEQGDPGEIESSLEQITLKYPVPAVAEAAAKLRSSITQESKRKEDAELAVIDSLRKEVSEAVPKAANTRDLDGLIEKLVAQIHSTSDHRTNKVTEANSGLIPLKIFASGWQDYLQARDAGEEMKANQILRYLSSTDEQAPVPRSTILARIIPSPAAAPPTAPPESRPPLSSQITELDQMTPALRELREMSENLRPSPAEFDRNNARATINALSALEKTYQDFKAGLPTDLSFLSQLRSSPDLIAAQPSISQLKAKLLILVLPTQLGLGAEDGPQPGESVITFLSRIEKTAAERGDTSICIGAINAKLTLRKEDALVDMERSALLSFQAAQAQETAGQMAAAVESYQNALRAGAGHAMATLVGKRLESIRKSHPAETRKAFERYQ
ncbi:MAG: hypothetical protein EOP88_00260 [Verrucomicrobiaceae bacterium]|nr:MAG: hypothetical protein EOP88_00260 [Verrucomicrobiaceae bacterium]